MKNAKVLLRIVLILCSVLLILKLSAQSGDSATVNKDELWPELNVFYKFNDKLRLFGTISGTRKERSQYSDGSLGIYLDYFGYPVARKMREGIDSTRGYYLWVRAGYLYGTSPPHDNSYKENTFRVEVNNRFYPGWSTMLTLKNLFEFRFVNGDFKPRLRPRLTWERDFRTKYMYFTAYVYPEYFIDFDLSTTNKLRLCAGAETKISDVIAFELYYLYQFDNKSQSSAVNAIGVVLKGYFNRKAPKKQHTKVP